MLDLLLPGQKTSPNFFWDFRAGTLPAGSAFTRGSAGWYFNSSGLLTQASPNVARHDHDPATLAPLGYLAEMQSTNGLLRSQEFDNASWTKQQGTIAADSLVAPDGTMTADKFTESAALAVHEVYQAITAAADSFVGASCFFKAGTRDKFFICLQTSSGNAASAVFDLATGTVGETKVGGTSGTIASTQIQAVGNGWYRCGMIAKQANANPVVTFGLAALATGNSFNGFAEPSYLGDGASYGHFWGAQADSIGVGVTSYVPTAGSTVTRSQDILSMPLASLPGWNANQGGVLVATYRLHTHLVSTGTAQPALLLTSTGSEWLEMQAQSGPAAGPIMYSAMRLAGGAYQFQLNGALSSFLARRRQVFGWSPSRGQVAADGTLSAVASGAYALPTGVTTINFGRMAAECLNGTLESVAYYGGARPDAFVIGASR